MAFLSAHCTLHREPSKSRIVLTHINFIVLGQSAGLVFESSRVRVIKVEYNIVQIPIKTCRYKGEKVITELRNEMTKAYPLMYVVYRCRLATSGTR